MPFQPAPDVFEAAFRYTMDGQACANILHFAPAAPGSDPDPTVLLNNLQTWYDSTLSEQQGVGVALNELVITYLGVEEGGQWTAPPTSDSVGKKPFPLMPNNVTIAVSLRTPVRGRSTRGRIYHVGLTEEQCEASRIVAGEAALILDAYQALLDPAVVGSAWRLCVLSRQHGGVPRPSGIYNYVTAVTLADATLDSQRRRLPGRGR